MPTTEPTRTIRLEEPDGRWSTLEVPADLRRVIQLAAGGVLAGCPESGGKSRAVDLLLGGGPAADMVALKVLREALDGALQH